MTAGPKVTGAWLVFAHDRDADPLVLTLKRHEGEDISPGTPYALSEAPGPLLAVEVSREDLEAAMAKEAADPGKAARKMWAAMYPGVIFAATAEEESAALEAAGIFEGTEGTDES